MSSTLKRKAEVDDIADAVRSVKAKLEADGISDTKSTDGSGDDDDSWPAGVDFPKILIYKSARHAFDPRKIVYTDPKPTAHGGYVSNCSYPLTIESKDGRSSVHSVEIILQTPTMPTTFGFSTKEHEAGKMRGTIDVAFLDSASTPAVDLFHEVLALWDKCLLKRAQKNKVAWFRSTKVTDDILTYLYNPMLRKNVSKKDGKEYADSFRIKVPNRKGVFVCEVFDADRTKIDITDITPQCTLKELTRHTGVWFSDTMFVSSNEALQVQKIAEGRMAGYGFVGDEDEEPVVTTYSMVE